MARVYRDGLDAMRRDFERKLKKARAREEALHRDAGSLFGRFRRDVIERTRAKLTGEIEDLDALTEAESNLADYRLLLKEAEDEVAAQRETLRRERLKVRALKVLAVASIGAVVVGFALWQSERGRINEAIAAETGRCRESEECKKRGLCTAQASHGNIHCVAAVDADCAGSVACERRGECNADDRGRCTATNTPDCEKSSGCRLFGACSFELWGCQATAASCKASEVCRELGRCKLGPSGCEAESAGSELGDSACRDEVACTYHGQCTETEDGCRATTAGECAASVGCAEKGRCNLKGHRCVISEAGCMHSSGCAFSDLCRVDVANDRCVADAG